MSETSEVYGRQAENESRQVWREDSQSGRSTLTSSEAGLAQDGSQVSRKPKRIYGKIGTRRILSPALVGGILSLERKRAVEALKNAEECIQWYAREKDRALEWISEIDALQAELTIDVDADSEIDSETE